MNRLVIFFSIIGLLILPACEQREQEQAQVQREQEQAQVQREQEQVQVEKEEPGEVTEQPVAPPAGEQPAVAQEQAQEQQPMAQQPPAQDQQAMAQQQEQPTAAQPPAGQTRDTAEFMGQAPKIEDAPETIVLEAKNGNVTLPHRSHAERMDCKTCHGEGKPGAIADFDKDKAHPLCQGCHKEQGAGPTKCAECHKK